MERKKVLFSLAALVVAVPLVMTGEAVAAKKINQSFDLPAQFQATIETSGCNALPGPQVTLQGALTASPLEVDVIFSHVMGAPDPKSGIAVNRIVVPPDEPILSPQRSIVGTMGGNPFLWLQLTDEKGRPLTSEIFLGRCDEGLFTPTIETIVPASAIGEISVSACDESLGPVAGLNGQVELSPLHANVIFRNGTTVGAPGGQAEVEVAILATGPTYSFPQEALEPQTGGNPLVSTQFGLEEEGVEIGAPSRLGRCSAIGN